MQIEFCFVRTFHPHGSQSIIVISETPSNWQSRLALRNMRDSLLTFHASMLRQFSKSEKADSSSTIYFIWLLHCIQSITILFRCLFLFDSNYYSLSSAARNLKRLSHWFVCNTIGSFNHDIKLQIHMAEQPFIKIWFLSLNHVFRPQIHLYILNHGSLCCLSDLSNISFYNGWKLSSFGNAKHSSFPFLPSMWANSWRWANIHLNQLLFITILKF